jgi:hypothetical protein
MTNVFLEIVLQILFCMDMLVLVIMLHLFTFQNTPNYIKCEVLVSVKILIIWIVPSCNLVQVHQYLETACCQILISVLLNLLLTLTRETIPSSEISMGFYQTTTLYIAENYTLNLTVVANSSSYISVLTKFLLYNGTVRYKEEEMQDVVMSHCILLCFLLNVSSWSPNMVFSW